MGKIENTRKSQWSHGLHLQFIRALLDIVLLGKYEAIKKKLGSLVDNLAESFEKERQCYVAIAKSNLSQLKADKDHERDNLIIGIKNLIRYALFHFDVNIREAARKLKIVIDAYDMRIPIINQAFDVETVTIINLIQELLSKYADEVKLLGLTEWLEKLEICNQEFDKLSKDYKQELSVKTPLHPRETRKDTDAAYENIVTVIEGAIIQEGIAEYADFVSELNVLIERTNNQLAQHLGHLHAKKAAEKNTKEEEEKKSDVTLDTTTLKTTKSNIETTEVKKEDNTNLDITKK